jgi:hypothetical protein
MQTWAIKVLGLVGMVLLYSPGIVVVQSSSASAAPMSEVCIGTGGGGDTDASKSSYATTDSSRDDSLLSLDTILADLKRKYSHQPTFLQAVQEMALSISDLLHDDNENNNALLYRKAFAVLTEPERTIAFRVSWMDDEGQLQYNRAWRVEFNRYATLSSVLLYVCIWNCKRLV